jgi:hypothetical protein
MTFFERLSSWFVEPSPKPEIVLDCDEYAERLKEQHCLNTGEGCWCASVCTCPCIKCRKTRDYKPEDRTQNETKAFMHRQARASLREARRAIASAQAERYLKNSREYEAWVLNAIDMLLEADECRKCARLLKWRD